MAGKGLTAFDESAKKSLQNDLMLLRAPSSRLLFPQVAAFGFLGALNNLPGSFNAHKLR
jgi:hypothetical protein